MLCCDDGLVSIGFYWPRSSSESERTVGMQNGSWLAGRQVRPHLRLSSNRASMNLTHIMIILNSRGMLQAPGRGATWRCRGMEVWTCAAGM